MPKESKSVKVQLTGVEAKGQVGTPTIHDLILDLSRRGHGAYVLLAAAQFENALEELICAHLPKLSKTLRAKLFTGYRAPFSNFSTKIDVAFACGEIDSETHHDLHVLREIRNEFAHPKQETHLELEEVLDLLKRFRNYDKKMDRFAFLGEKVNQLWAAINPRFETLAMVAALQRSFEQKRDTSPKKS